MIVGVWRPTWCQLIFYFTSYVLNMFRTLIYPSSGACDCRLKHNCASACKTSTTQTQPHQISNTQRTENKTTDVVIQQQSRKLLKMDILMSETCWTHKKWNKISSDIELVFHTSTVTMMQGPINIRFAKNDLYRVWIESQKSRAVVEQFLSERGVLDKDPFVPRAFQNFVVESDKS